MNANMLKNNDFILGLKTAGCGVSTTTPGPLSTHSCPLGKLQFGCKLTQPMTCSELPVFLYLVEWLVAH